LEGATLFAGTDVAEVKGAGRTGKPLFGQWPRGQLCFQARLACPQFADSFSSVCTHHFSFALNNLRRFDFAENHAFAG
jgi:hypothetical protein